MLGLKIGAGQHVDLEAGCERLAPLLVDRLALPGIERGKVVGEGLVPVVGPVELLAHALEEPGLEQDVGVGILGEIDVQRGNPALPGEFDEPGDQRRLGVGRCVGRDQQARPRHRGERHRAQGFRIIAPAGALIGVGPPIIKDVLAVGMALQIKRDDADDAPAPNRRARDAAAPSRCARSPSHFPPSLAERCG